jgi:hypothetical protein
VASNATPVIPVPLPIPGNPTIPVPIPVPIPGPSIIPGVGAAEQALSYVSAAKAWVSDRHNWVRVGWTTLGVVLIYGGVIVIARKPIAASATKAAALAAKVA